MHTSNSLWCCISRFEAHCGCAYVCILPTRLGFWCLGWIYEVMTC